MSARRRRSCRDAASMHRRRGRLPGAGSFRSQPSRDAGLAQSRADPALRSARAKEPAADDCPPKVAAPACRMTGAELVKGFDGWGRTGAHGGKTRRAIPAASGDSDARLARAFPGCLRARTRPAGGRRPRSFTGLQAWIGPSPQASAASRTASEKVGWAWQVRATSSAEAPNSIATHISWMRSPAEGPMM